MLIGWVSEDVLYTNTHKHLITCFLIPSHNIIIYNCIVNTIWLHIEWIKIIGDKSIIKSK